MRKNRLHTICLGGLGALIVATLLLPSCSINVKKEKNGQEKQVDINTPVGGIHVSKDADATEIGLPVYPGAHVKEEDSSGHPENARVNLSGFGYGLKVVAMKYASDDPPSKIVAFYREQLKKYGSVLECHTSSLDLSMKFSDRDRGSRELTCQGASGSNVELKAGTPQNQHIVAVEPDGKGSSFSLVYVRTHSKEAEI
jgi:hypothetical protein